MINKIFVSDSAKEDSVTAKIIKHYPKAKIYEVGNALASEKIVEGNPKKNLLLTHSKGDVIRACPGTSKQYLCCRYQIINQTLNCPFNCTYCILQYYLNQAATIIYTDIENILSDLDEALANYGKRFIRIGTGELGDSLALYGSRLFAKEAVQFFAEQSNILFELKTKSNRIEPLLNVNHNRRTVVAWSLNPQKVITQEEAQTNTLGERLAAAKTLEKKNYLLAFHFDPIIKKKNWKQLYGNLIDKLYSTINPNNIVWISMGSLRFPPSTKEEIQQHYPGTKIIYEEMTKGLDGKLRYPRPLRLPMYKFIYQKLSSVENPPFIYFCMENKTVWEEVMGVSPKNNSYLDFLFAKSIYNRFDKIIPASPKIEDFDKALNLDGSRFQ